MGERLSALTARVALTAHRVAKAPTTRAWRRAGVISRISSSHQRQHAKPRNERAEIARLAPNGPLHIADSARLAPTGGLGGLGQLRHSEQVAFAVLEPGRFGVAQVRDAFDRLQIRVVVLLE